MFEFSSEEEFDKIFVDLAHTYSGTQTITFNVIYYDDTESADIEKDEGYRSLIASTDYTGSVDIKGIRIRYYGSTTGFDLQIDVLKGVIL